MTKRIGNKGCCRRYTCLAQHWAVGPTVAVQQKCLRKILELHLQNTGKKKGCCWGYTCLAQQLPSNNKKTWKQKYTSHTFTKVQIHLTKRIGNKGCCRGYTRLAQQSQSNKIYMKTKNTLAKDQEYTC